MVWLFVAATIFGGAFLVPMLLGGLASDVGDGLGGDLGDADLDVGSGIDVDVDMDLEVEADLGVEVDAAEASAPDVAPDLDGSNFGDAFGSIFASLLSFRTVVFFSAFFGTSGLVFSALDYSPATSLIAAIVVGVIAALINSTLFGLIKNSQPNSQISDRTLEGRQAKVVLPMSSEHRGRIRIDLSGQPQYLVARPIDDGSGQQFDVGASVVVVTIEDGTALVASLAELESGEEY